MISVPSCYHKGWEVLWIYSSASVKYNTDNAHLQMFPHGYSA